MVLESERNCCLWELKSSGTTEAITDGEAADVGRHQSSDLRRPLRHGVWA